MRFLRFNTAVIKQVGPFYDRTDGVTPETLLTITNERITLTADTDAGSAPTIILDNIAGATSGTANDLNYITGQDNGMMQIEFAAADVNRLGSIRLTITDAANHVPVFEDFTILPQMIFDSLILGTDFLQVDLTQSLGLTPYTGTLEAGSTTTGTLPAGTRNGTTTDFYNGWTIIGKSGSGNSQAPRVVTAYNFSTGVVTFAPALATAFSSDTVFAMPHPTTSGLIGATDYATAASQAVSDANVDAAEASILAQVAVVQADLPVRITKNVAFSNFTFPMIASSDHVTRLTGLTVAAQRSIDGAAFANCATATATEIGTTGRYKINFANTDLNGDAVHLKFTATGADDLDIFLTPQPS